MSTDLETVVTCAECDETVDLDCECGYWSDTAEGFVCQGCWDSAFEHASCAYLAGPGVELELGERSIPALYVTEHGIFDQWMEGVDSPLVRAYHRTDGWRGYYVTRVTEPGWVEVAAGWTTGDWGDAIADRKQDFNAWAESVITGDVVPDHPVWIITDPTSNVFSTAVSVWVPDQYADKASIPEGL